SPTSTWWNWPATSTPPNRARSRKSSRTSSGEPDTGHPARKHTSRTVGLLLLLTFGVRRLHRGTAIPMDDKGVGAPAGGFLSGCGGTSGTQRLSQTCSFLARI